MLRRAAPASTGTMAFLVVALRRAAFSAAGSMGCPSRKAVAMASS